MKIKNVSKAHVITQWLLLKIAQLVSVYEWATNVNTRFLGELIST